MKKRVSIFLIFLCFFVFLALENKKGKTYKVLEVLEGDKIVLDLNSNGKSDPDEIIHLKNLNTFPLKYSPKAEEYACRFALSPKEVLILGHAAKIYTKTVLSGKKVSILGHLGVYNKNYTYRFGEISYEGRNFGEILLENGLAFAYEPKDGRGFNPYKTFENTKKIKRRAKEFKNLKLPPDAGFFEEGKPLPGRENKGTRPGARMFSESLQKTFQNVTIFLINPNSYSKPSFLSRTNAAKALIKEINSANETIDFALYGIDGQNEIYNALLNAKNRGVKIRGVIDSKPNGTFVYQDTKKLAESFLAIKDSRAPFMHNKFFIFDNKKVFTGSMNISTTGSGGYNSNTVLLINSKDAAKVYGEEFNQMFEGKFQYLKEDKSAFGLKMGENAALDIIFSPKGGFYNKISPLLRGAKKEILVSIFYLTHKGIIEDLINAKKRGVDVKIIYDAVGANNMKPKVNYLRNSGVKVKVENWGGKNHEKNIVIDSKYFITGSANFSNSANNKNDENILIFKSPEIAGFYRNYFLKLYNSIDEKYLKFYPRAESFESINSCYDGIDNNFDGKADSEDAGCRR